MTARSERPISRLISWVRPPMRPLTDSRSERVLVEAGSIAYSAVTQPRPEPLRQRGTPSEADAAHSTRVLPNSTSTEPGRVVEPVAGDRDRAELVVGPAVAARAGRVGVVMVASLVTPAPGPAGPRPWTPAVHRVTALLHLGAQHPPEADASGMPSQIEPETSRCAHSVPVTEVPPCSGVWAALKSIQARIVSNQSR